MILPRRVTCLLAVALTAGLAGASSASAAVLLKVGPSAFTQQANCLPAQITPGYSQQTTEANPAVGIEPRVGDAFYLSVRIDTLTSFDCAADFSSVLVTLPPNVQPAVGGSAIPICRRFGTNSLSQTVFDPRATTNCPTSITFDAANRQFPLRPIASPVLPDVGGPAGSFWFTGIRAPQESQEYPSVQLLVPVKATATVTAQPISFFVCTVGTSCATASVDLTVTAAPSPGQAPISLPGNAITSATGARVPFTINAAANQTYNLKVDTATNAAFTTRPCGLIAPVTYQSSGGVPFQGPFASEVQYGDLQQGGTICNLAPLTTYHFRACSVNNSNNADIDCRTTTFTTGAVVTTLQRPADTTADRPQSGSMVVRMKVLAGHPAGTQSVRQRLKGSGGGFAIAASQGVSAATGDGPEFAPTLSGLVPWRTYELVACLNSGTDFCSDSVDVVTGMVTTGGDATSVTATTAVVGAAPSAPFPSGTMSFRVGTTDPNGRGILLPEKTSVALAANGTSTTPAPISATLSGLTPATTHYWSVCFDGSSEAGVEACSPVRTFTAGAAPVAPTGPATGTPPPPAAPLTGGVKLAAGTSLPRSSLAKGLPLAATCSKAARVALTLRVSKKVATRLRIPSPAAGVVIATGSARCAAGVPTKVRLITKRALRARIAARGAGARVTLVVVLTAADGSRIRRTLPARLK